jgi:hypothetical protein
MRELEGEAERKRKIKINRGSRERRCSFCGGFAGLGPI